jgi:putative flippase GtrA
MSVMSHLDGFVRQFERHRLFGRPAQFYGRRHEQILYLVVGAWNTLFGYLIWAFMQYLLHDYIFYLFILVLAWFPAVLNAYVCYRYFVFRSKGSVWRELPRFSLVYVGTLCASLIGLPILLRLLPFSIYLTQALFTAAMVIVSYLSHKYFSFKGGRETPIPEGRDELMGERPAEHLPSREGTL